MTRHSELTSQEQVSCPRGLLPDNLICFLLEKRS